MARNPMWDAQAKDWLATGGGEQMPAPMERSLAGLAAPDSYLREQAMKNRMQQARAAADYQRASYIPTEGRDMNQTMRWEALRQQKEQERMRAMYEAQAGQAGGGVPIADGGRVMAERDQKLNYDALRMRRDQELAAAGGQPVRAWDAPTGDQPLRADWDTPTRSWDAPTGDQPTRSWDAPTGGTMLTQTPDTDDGTAGLSPEALAQRALRERNQKVGYNALKAGTQARAAAGYGAVGTANAGTPFQYNVSRGGFGRGF